MARTGRTRVVWAACAAALALDLLVASLPTGVLVVAALGLGCLRVWRMRPDGSRYPRVRAAVTVLVVGAGLLGAARAWLVVLRIVEGPEALGPTAVRTYDLMGLALIGGAWLLAARPTRPTSALHRIVRRPAALLASSFVLLIATATLLLLLPVSLRRVADVSLVDALFTATSAVCVTGLVVSDVGTTYTGFGQAVILVAIQLGGVGIMTVGAFALLLRREGALGDQARYAVLLEARSLRELRVTVRGILVSTLVIEALGALALYALLAGDPRVSGKAPVWLAVFHAVSAFCNAGFSLFSQNLVPFADRAGVQLVICALVVAGGIGYPVLRDIARRLAVPGNQRLSLWSRTALAVSGALIVLGATAFALLESSGAMVPLGALDRVMASLFSSVSARTAGFNTLEVGAVGPTTLLVLMALMFIGGSPGSTAGGIKTTTAAVLFAALRGELRRREPELGGRALAPESVRRATAVVVISLMIVFTSLLLLTLTERHGALQLAFEAVSAFATVGLSTGVTPDLSVAGKLVVTATMFVGRVGPLTVALAVGDDYAQRPYRLPPEELPIG